MKEYLYTVNEVAEILKVNRNMVYGLINKGLLKAIKLGRIKVPAFEIERFLQEYIGKDLSDLDNIKDFNSNDNTKELKVI